MLLLTLAGCGAEEGRVLRVAETVSLADSAATLAIDAGGRQWLGRPGGLRVRDPAGSVRDLGLPGAAIPRVVGWMDETAYVRQGETLLAFPEGADSVSAARGGFGADPLLCDVRGRAVLQGARSGAVLGHHHATLEPLWAWAAPGAPSSALAASPEGDRVYHALEPEEEAPRVLIRDLQTGRELGHFELASPLRQLVAADDGMLYGVGREGRRAVILALRPGGDTLETVWRRSLPLAEAAATVRVAVAGARVAVWGRGPGQGLRIVDAQDGAILGRTRTDPLDFSFGAKGELWALYPGELRRLE